MKSLLKTYKKLFHESRGWILFAVVLALVWVGAGAFLVSTFPGLFPRYLSFLHETFDKLLGNIGEKTRLELAVLLFGQNFRATVLDLGLGFFFGIVPVISIAFNFFALGFLGGTFLRPDIFFAKDYNFSTFFLSIAPHGVFELPALIIGAAFGLRLGWRWLLPASTGRRWKVLREDSLAAIMIVPVLFVLLLIAAFVESYVTGALVR
ncbi:MAG: stage II sporulation protein M [bacterium]|nr:stage II sporulation protein M [bacterium]